MYVIKMTRRYENNFVSSQYFLRLTNFIEWGRIQDARRFNRKADAKEAAREIRQCMAGKAEFDIVPVTT